MDAGQSKTKERSQPGGVGWWPGDPSDERGGVAAKRWSECFWRALRRVTLSVNHQTIPDATHLLRRPDDIIDKEFLETANLRQLCRFSIEEVTLDESELEHEFRHFFYGELRTLSIGEGRTQLAYKATPTFMKATFEGQQCSYSDEELGLVDSEAEEKALTLGTAYLVKNIWHNYVHNVLQGINEGNYHGFRGRGRYQSDFAADNLATILMAKAYGYEVHANSTRATYEGDADHEIVKLLHRNRSNRAFALRAEQLGETLSEADKRWQYRRRIAVYTSGRLLASHRAPATLSVYITEPKKGSPEQIAVEIDGHFFATGRDILKSFLKDRNEVTDDERKKEHEHLSRIAEGVDNAYRQLLEEHPRIAECNTQMLQARLEALGVHWGTVDEATVAG